MGQWLSTTRSMLLEAKGQLVKKTVLRNQSTTVVYHDGHSQQVCIMQGCLFVCVWVFFFVCSFCFCFFWGGVPCFPGGLDSVEYYDITTNKWHAASRMPWRSLTVKCVPVGDVIFVLAGRGLGAQCLTNVLEYHTKTNRLVHQLNTVDINYMNN